MRELLQRLRPRTIRARVAVAIIVALAVVSALVIGVDWIVQGRARAEVEEALQQQADGDREGDRPRGDHQRRRRGPQR